MAINRTILGRQQHTVLAVVALLLLGMVLTLAGPLVSSPAAAAPPPAKSNSVNAPPVIERSVSDAGFIRPGVGLTADHLETMRSNVAAGVDPWASYFDAMAETRYAAKTYVADNLGASDNEPASDAYDNAGMRSRALRDGIGAMTQSLMYVVTGDEIYRANALKTIRAWSSMDPSKYAYFPDAHIHTGDPLYKMLVAAEIIRSTTPVNDELDGYDLRWTQRDDQRIEDNLIRPVVETFLYSPNRLWNQHVYGVIGGVAAGIFLDDPELYAERVEWFTVNANYTSEHTINGGDVNGALASVFRLIEADDPINHYGFSFVQHLEMGRDQAHAEGDVDIFAALARIVHNQGTRLDPVHGTVSAAPDAVTPYTFLDNRILAGAEAFAAFMMGEEVPYVDMTGGSGTLSQAYRGRLVDALGELYYQYKYVADVDVAEVAPHLTEAFEQRDGPTYYYGNEVANFWNERGSDFNGAEYWVAFPAELAEEEVHIPELVGPQLDVGRFGRVIGDGASHQVGEGGSSYVHLDSSLGLAQVAVRRAVFPDRSSEALVGFHVRTEEPTIMRVSPTASDRHAADVRLPDTQGEWRYVALDINQEGFPVSPVGHHILFLTAPEGTPAFDVAHVWANANDVLSPPIFEGGAQIDLVAVAEEPVTAQVDVSDDEEVSIELQGQPAGLLLDAGMMSWTPEQSDAGVVEFLIRAGDPTTDSVAVVTIEVASSRAGAVDAVLAGLAPEAEYTTSSWSTLQGVRSQVLDMVESAGSTEFQAGLLALQEARDALALLNPRLSDGTLNFSEIITAPGLSYPALLGLTDGDNLTHWGDQRVKEIIFDFGSGYRVQTDAFGFLARDSFPNRAEGTNVYGSTNASDWTLLTEYPNTGDDVSIETIPVMEQHRDSRFRFLKLQVDEPGIPTDPAYPGIWSIADLRISGERSEAVGSLDSVSIGSPGSVAGRVVPGERVELTITGPSDITDLNVTIGDEAADIEQMAPGEWVAGIFLRDDVASELGFAIDFTTPDGQQADTVEATSDGSKLYVSSDEDLLDPFFAGSEVVGPDGVMNSTLTAQAALVFDQDAATHSDVRANAGQIALTWDFGDGEAVSLTGADLLVRQDGYGISRIDQMRLEGSNDRENWTRLTPDVPQGTLDWQSWSIGSDDGYRYIRLINGQIMGVAELRLFGSVADVPEPDTVAPTVTVKEGVEFTVGSADEGFELVSFKLFDEFLIDKVAINGVIKDLTDNQWSDVNFVKPGVFGAVLGDNVLEVFDVAGNVTTVTFTLVGPTAQAPAWDPSLVYTTGDEVSHGGAVYIAQWWTQNQAPGNPTGPWSEVGASVPAAGEGVRAWTASWIYTGGETVAHDGHTWRAKWWTRNQAPGDVYGPWEDLGSY